MDPDIYDFSLSRHSSFFVLTPNHLAAETWLFRNTSDDLREVGSGYGIDHRYIGDLCRGILNEGFQILFEGNYLSVSEEGELVIAAGST